MIEFISQLPTEYQEVEYIESSGTQYIDTGFVVNKSDSYVLEIDGLFPSQAQAYQGCNGYMQFITSSKYGISGDSSVAVGNRNTVRVEYANQTEKLFVDGAQIESKSWSAYDGSDVKLALFRLGDINNGWFTGTIAQGTIYGYKVWKNNILVSECVPCVRNSDNVAGVYDVIREQFITNVGSGVFTVGANSNKHTIATITPGGIIPMQYALRRMMMSALGSGIDVAALSITYTGAYTDYGMVTMSDGARYRLLAFTSSGTLSIEQPVNCEVCVVGGGANGAKAAGDRGGDGGAGAYLKTQSVSAYNGGSVVVGAGQGVSSIADVSVNAVSGKNGGTGAGGHTAGTGDGISKYPFEDTGYSLWAGKPHCGGGGQGAYASREFSDTGAGYSGGNGGTNGGNGYPQASSWTSSPSGGVGGSYGGGKGNSGEGAGQGENATYYGSGAGGGLCYKHTDGKVLYYNGGIGYQGIVYMRIPVMQ